MPTEDPIDNPDAPLHNTDFRAVTEAIAGNGIQSPGDFEITAGTADMDIDIAPGTAEYDGGTSSLGATATTTITAADSDDRRWDAVAWDHATSSVVVRDGTPGAASVPDIQGDEIYLGKVEVPAGATQITAEEIYNWRVTADSGGGGGSDVISSPNGHIPTALLEDTESAEISVPVADGETLTVKRWGGYKISDRTAPTGLDVQLLDGSDTVQASANTTDNRSSSGVASYTNSSGSLSIFKLRVDNATGTNYTTDGVGAVFGYEVA